MCLLGQLVCSQDVSLHVIFANRIPHPTGCGLRYNQEDAAFGKAISSVGTNLSLGIAGVPNRLRGSSADHGDGVLATLYEEVIRLKVSITESAHEATGCAQSTVISIATPSTPALNPFG